MDGCRFDRLARALVAEGSRREAVVALLIGLATPLLPDPGEETRGKSKGKGKGRNRGKDRRRKRKASGNEQRQTQSQTICYGGSPCVVGPRANLSRCNLAHTSLLNANCQSCNLGSANLTRANAAGAVLTSANLGKACLVDADLTNANLASANLSGAIFCRTKMPNGSINNSGCTKPTSCCPTCKPLGESGCDLGGTCCPGGVCQSGTCVCDAAACAAVGGCCVGGVCDTNALQWVRQTTFGSGPGDGPSEFDFPFGLAVSDDGGRAWVADANNNRISVWTEASGVWSNETTFGSSGSGAGFFDFPAGVAVSADGRTVWVADANNARISVWTEVGGVWSEQTHFSSAFAALSVAVAADERTAWVPDVGRSQVEIWTEAGGSWSLETDFGSGPGSGPSEFDGPIGVAVSADGRTAWVTDSGNDRVSVWREAGGVWSNQTTFGSSGTGPGKLDGPSGIALSAGERTAVVADTGNNRVSVWVRSGAKWTNRTTFGSGPGGVSQPNGVAVSPDGQTAWVVETDNSRVSVWALVCVA